MGILSHILKTVKKNVSNRFIWLEVDFFLKIKETLCFQIFDPSYAMGLKI
jgi:hypothetical protein